MILRVGYIPKWNTLVVVVAARHPHRPWSFRRGRAVDVERGRQESWPSEQRSPGARAVKNPGHRSSDPRDRRRSSGRVPSVAVNVGATATSSD